MNFEFAYVASLESNLTHEQIGRACAAYSIIADEATDNDRSAWTIWVYGANFGVGFHSERHRERFAEIFAEFTEAARLMPTA